MFDLSIISSLYNCLEFNYFLDCFNYEQGGMKRRIVSCAQNNSNQNVLSENTWEPKIYFSTPIFPIA